MVLHWTLTILNSMQGSDLKSIILRVPSLKNHFLGIFSIDTLPNSINRRTFLFSNTSVQTEVGEHWICICKADRGVEIFDSLGLDSNKKDLYSRYCKFKKTPELNINETAFQLATSSTCGLFVIYFVVQRFHNLDLGFKTLLNEIFSSSNALNEEIVKKFCDQL